MSVERKLTVAPGLNSDPCPLCGIHRENAGYHVATCGMGYLKPGCFTIPRDALAAVGVPPDERGET